MFTKALILLAAVSASVSASPPGVIDGHDNNHRTIKSLSTTVKAPLPTAKSLYDHSISKLPANVNRTPTGKTETTCFTTKGPITLSGTSSDGLSSSTASSTVNPSVSSDSLSSSLISSTELRTASISESSSLSTSPSSTLASLGSSLSCPTDLPYSCQNTTIIEDMCCFEYPGGAILSTQFWDYDPATGPNNSFTIHGLWPDNCDGTYEQYCDTTIAISNATDIISQFDPSLLKTMQLLWKDYQGDDESLWEHEYNKHGTCYSTINPSCYGENSTYREDVYDFFRVAVELNNELPTYDWLVSEGIVPSLNVTYTKDEVLGALTKHYGYEPYIKCDSNNAISEVWYFHHVKGSLRDGIFERFDTLTTPNCPSTGIYFPPKGSTITSSTTTKNLTSSSSSSTATGVSVKGYVTLTGEDGCLIKNGNWYVSGTCATYTLEQLSTLSYTLKSSAGYCTITDNIFTCSSNVTTPFEFDYDASTNVISAGGEDTWYADSIASGTTKVPIHLGSGGAVTFELQFGAI